MIHDLFGQQLIFAAHEPNGRPDKSLQLSANTSQVNHIECHMGWQARKGYMISQGICLLKLTFPSCNYSWQTWLMSLIWMCWVFVSPVHQQLNSEYVNKRYSWLHWEWISTISDDSAFGNKTRSSKYNLDVRAYCVCAYVFSMMNVVLLFPANKVVEGF